MRIASLLPSATEILIALGIEDSLVAVSHSCDFAGPVEALPRATSTRVPAGASSREIDAVVRECLHRGESLYRLDDALLESLRPDLIVTQALCEVCAVGPAEVERALPALSSSPQRHRARAAHPGGGLRRHRDGGRRGRARRTGGGAGVRPAPDG